MEEILWLIGKRSQSMQDLRQDIQGVWNDEAAKAVNIRFLNPHEADDIRMRQALCEQQAYILKSQAAQQQALCHAQEADREAEEVEHYLELTQQEIEQADQYREFALESCLASEMLLPEIEELLKSANGACDYYPKKV